ncbi:MAG: beta-glucosidase BglX [Bacteroidales bacterium]|nr:beta-glucosidase BglX [Bacteroidales bacterium]
MKIITGLYKFSLLAFLLMLVACKADNGVEHRETGEEMINNIISTLSLEEKVGQMTQINSVGPVNDDLRGMLQAGKLGSMLNEVDVKRINEIQRIAVEESPSGIPLLFARDVVHGFKTIFPIPPGLASTFNPELVKECSAAAAAEAWSSGINWNFGPMIDVVRDPRWGRIAESFGEDPYLVSAMGVATVEGFQGDDLAAENTLAASAKHFAGYGAAEGGRDYNTTLIPRRELHNIYLPPFEASVRAGVKTFMPGFNDLDGVPASGNSYLLQDILRGQWGFKGLVVSDWASIYEMINHGFAADSREAALRAFKAGVNIEMASSTYRDNIISLVKAGKIKESEIDRLVKQVLMLKYELGLFDNPYIPEKKQNVFADSATLMLAEKAAMQSVVLLKNNVLPLEKDSEIALTGPLAHQMYEQLGTWNFDGDSSLSVTPLMAMRELAGSDKINFAPGLRNSRSSDSKGFKKALNAAYNSDIIVFCAGEEAIITGEAHSRAYLDLPGAQNELIKELAATGKPIILAVLAGRPLTIGEISEYADAVLYAWHPGTMGGKAIAKIIYGDADPSAKLPVTFPVTEGQIPIYYNHKMTGRPVIEDEWVHINDIPEKAFQTSLGNTSHYIDAGFEPLYPFGFGLSYTTFEYSDLKISSPVISITDTLEICFVLRNTGKRSGTEVAQLYTRDIAASITRPVKELSGFKRVQLEPGESRKVEFLLPAANLGFHGIDLEYRIEEGEFKLWVGGDSNASLSTSFEIKNKL